jgi:hypothetical protein
MTRIPSSRARPSFCRFEAGGRRSDAARLLKAGCYDPPVRSSLNIPELVSDTEQEILRLVSDRDVPTSGLYAMCRYHLGLDGSGSSGKRLRPLLGLLAYA